MADKKISALTGATTPLDGTEVLPIVQSGSTVKVANNDLRPKQIQSNATSGVLQIAGPAATTTRVMTVPDANFTVARTDAAQTFTGNQTVTGDFRVSDTYSIYLATGAEQKILAAGGAGTSYLTFSQWTGSVYTDRIRFDGNGNLQVFNGNLIPGTAAKGINFTANTPAAGMTSQLLNWYEEGTWTPTFTNFGTTNLLFAKYTRIGRAVAINLRFEVTAATANSSYFTLPFNSSEITSGTWVRSTVEGGFVEVNAGANCYFASTPSSTAGAFAISATYFV